MLRNSIHRAIRTNRKIETTGKTMENLAPSRHVPCFQVSRVYIKIATPRTSSYGTARSAKSRAKYLFRRSATRCAISGVVGMM